MKEYKVIFFDFENVLFELRNGTWVYREQIEPLLLADPEIPKGVLCNLPAGLTPEELKLMLKSKGAEALFDPTLFIFPSLLNATLPEPRAFAAAAALAGVPLDQMAYVTANKAWHQQLQQAGTPIVKPYDVPSAGALFAEEIASAVVNAHNSFVINGRVATMENGKVINKGSIAVENGIIVEVFEQDGGVPDRFSHLPVINTNATLFPGFIDLHNHYAYNVAQLWKVPKKYNNRGAWFRNGSYQGEVSMPLKMLAGYTPTAKAIARFVEAKAIMGGTCTGQGIARNKGGGIKMYRGAMRNVESSGNENLPQVNAQVLDLQIKKDGEIEKFRKNLTRYKAMFYHLSEGVDEGSRKRFLELKDNDLLQPSLIGIHSLALQATDISDMAKAKSKVVWSPFSNLLLYGNTLQLKPLLDSGIVFSLGCDWSPSGGKNILVELKVARFVADMQNAGIDNRKLVEMITCDPAEVLGWHKHLGKLSKGMIADIVAIAGQEGDPYEQLVKATEEKVAMVIVDGVPRYGDLALMEKVYGANSSNIEKFDLKQKKKAFYLFSEDSALNDLPLSDAVKRLDKSLSDLPALKVEIETPRPSLLADEEEFTLALDMEDYEDDEPVEPELFAAVQMADSIPLDSLYMVENDLDLIDQQSNIPQGLAKFIRDAY